MIIEIVILAMVAAFLGLRLYSVLGRRAEQEEESIVARLDPAQNAARTQALVEPAVAALPEGAMKDVSPITERALRDISQADRGFDIIRFLEGAKGAYGMVLEAFWKGDRATLKQLCDADVFDGFSAAITAREKAGETLENSLIRIEEAIIGGAQLAGNIARVQVQFVSDIAAVTRDNAGVMVAGSLDDAIVSRDNWTFMRDVKSADPAWLLDETDEG